MVDVSAPLGSVRAMGDLDDTDRQILDFEQQRWKYPGAKETAVRDRFGLTPTRYYMRLNRLIDQPEANAYAPLLVHRLRRLRAARAWQRDPHRLDA